MARRPNILFLFPDQLRFDWLGGNPEIPVRTPNLERLAREGASFTNALCPSPLCAPSRACLASGKEYDDCRVPGNDVDYPLDQPTFYQMLRDSGYHVAGCGKFDLHKATRNWGLDGKRLLRDWGFSDGIDSEGKWDGVASGAEEPVGPYLNFLEQRGLRQAHIDDFAKRRGHKDAISPTTLPDDAYSDNWIGQNGLDLMQRFPEDKPWFLQVNFTGPHDPWDITPGMKEWYKGMGFPPPVANDQFPKTAHDQIRQNYSAMVENIDRWLGLYLAELTRRGELADTLIVFSSDHGEMLGDHNRWGKGGPYQPSVGVPLILRGPDLLPGKVCKLPTTILDLTATFLERAGLTVPADMDSRSLWPLLTGGSSEHRDQVSSGLRTWRLAFDGRYKLIRGWEDAGDLLFDLETDPLETANLAAERPAEVRRLEASLPPFN